MVNHKYNIYRHERLFDIVLSFEQAALQIGSGALIGYVTGRRTKEDSKNYSQVNCNCLGSVFFGAEIFELRAISYIIASVTTALSVLS